MRGSYRPIGWGIVGAGHIAGVFARDLALLAPDARLVAIGSRSLAKAKRFVQEQGAERSYGSYAALAEDPDVDVVYVASTHNDHHDSARLCLEAGKAVLVEKPLTPTPKDTADLVALAQARDCFLMEAVWNRTNPLTRKMIEMVAAGRLGAVRHVSASFGFRFEGEAGHRLLDPAQAGGGILDLGVYPVHAVQSLLGEPVELAAEGHLATTGVDAHAAALLSFPPKEGAPPATASVLCSLVVDLPSRLEVFGELGSLVLDDFIRPQEMRWRFSEDGTVGEETFVTSLPGSGYTFEAQEVMRCLRAGEIESPLVPWEDTLAVARSLERWQAGVRSAVGAA